jgi:uncharacterized membrane protein
MTFVDGLAVARVLHVLAVVVWIGGVALVTAAVLPAARAADDGPRLFEAVERRFAWIARAMTLIVGASGLYMVWAADLWSRFADAQFWWMDAMVAVWAVFVTILFVVEPLFERRISSAIARDPQRMFRRMARAHWVLLAASGITIAGAVAGAHGFSLF